MTKRDFIETLNGAGWTYYAELGQVCNTNSVILFSADDDGDLWRELTPNDQCACTDRDSGLARIASYEDALAWALNGADLGRCKLAKIA